MNSDDLDSDPDRLSDDALEHAVRGLAATLDASLRRLVELLVEFDERGLWAGDGFRSCAHWLGVHCGLSVGAAREQLRVGWALRTLPETDAAFTSGALSYSKARAITRVATPDNEGFLLSIARYGSAAHVERLVAMYCGSPTPEALEAERGNAARVADRRTLTHHTDEDGMLVLRARLPPEEGALLVKALDTAVEQLDGAAEVPTARSTRPIRTRTSPRRRRRRSYRPRRASGSTPAAPTRCR